MKIVIVYLIYLLMVGCVSGSEQVSFTVKDSYASIGYYGNIVVFVKDTNNVNYYTYTGGDGNNACRILDKFQPGANVTVLLDDREIVSW